MDGRSSRSPPHEIPVRIASHDVTRRSLLGAGAAAVVLPAAALAQRLPAPPRQKGPLVWLDMDQQELDDAYDQSVYAPNQRAHPRAHRREQRAHAPKSRRARARAYGPTSIESARHLHAEGGRTRRCNVFIHGGAWRPGLPRTTRSSPSTFVDAGAHFVVLDFNNVIRPAAT